MIKTSPLQAAAILIAAAVLPFVIATTALAQEGDGEPEIVSQNLNEGDVLGEPPHVVQFCFARPVTAEQSGEDYSFSLISPDGLPTANRTVFQRDRLGVAIYPGDPANIPGRTPSEETVWTFEWLVTDAETGEAAEGSISFTVEEGAEVIPNEDPPPCLSEDFTAVPTETGTGSPTPADAAGDDDDDDDDWLLIALAAGGAVIALGVIAAIAVAVARSRARRRAGEPGGDIPSGQG